MQSSADDIKRRVTCVDYASRAGLPIRRDGDRCASFLEPGHNKTSCIFRNEYWYDFKAQAGGDVIDLCALVSHSGDKGAAFRELREIAGISESNEYSSWRDYTQNLCNLVQKWHEDLRPEDYQYLHSRAIGDETIKRNKIGWNGRLVVPYFKNGYVCYYISRGDEPKYKKAKLDGLNENTPWGLHSIGKTETLIITEGAFDALSFEQEGFSVLATMGGFFTKEQLKTVIAICRNMKRVIMIFDNDDAGHDFTVKLSEQLFKSRVKFEVGTVPNGKKDVSEYYTAGGDLNQIIDGAKNGLESMCETVRDDRDSFKSFAVNAGRFVPKPEMAELFAQAKPYFPVDWLKEVKKLAMAAPPESVICREVINDHKLLFNEGLGFFEYTSGYWKRRNDTEIQAFISAALGQYKTGSKLSSILKLIKSECVTTDVFNKRPVFNFQNGTLDLMTGAFRDPLESDMCSVQTSYPYDQSAVCPQWDRFMDEITDYKNDRKALLQEVAGYALFTDNSMQKCFFLIGSGANGKSVYLDILTRLFGDETISNIEMSGLIEPFQRIQLMDAILNISTETRSNVKGAESIFKQVIAGDMINGCFKNKDFVQFRPRAKFVMAGNDYFKPRDLSYGFLRRMGFVKFENRFVDDPHGQHEFQADKKIIDKLREELPGIFNWAYAGYKRLVQVGEFTETFDSEELLREFKEAINPIITFIEELENLPDRIIYKEIYNDYRQWCIMGGHNPMNRENFSKQFREVFLKEYPTWEAFRTGTVRGVRKRESAVVQMSFDNRVCEKSLDSPSPTKEIDRIQ